MQSTMSSSDPHAHGVSADAGVGDAQYATSFARLAARRWAQGVVGRPHTARVTSVAQDLMRMIHMRTLAVF